MALHPWRVVEPDDFYKSFIERNTRPDGRKFMQQRPVLVKTNSVTTAEGSATVRLGNTTIMCGIKAEIAPPDLRRLDEGFLIPNVELYPCSLPTVKSGMPGDRAMSTTTFLVNVIESSGLIDLKKLCIVEKKFSWCLYCDIICLDYDGNILDASLIALVAALRNVRLPKISFDEETETIKASSDRTEKLEILSIPTSSTFSIYNSEVQMLDPTAEDEERSTGLMTIVLKEDNSRCVMNKSGGHVLPQETLEKLYSLSKKRSQKLLKIINESVPN